MVDTQNQDFVLLLGGAPLPSSPRQPAFGLNANAPWQSTAGAVFRFAGYTLGIVEFDDQGLCYGRGQMEAVERELAQLHGRNPIVVVFVHGWKHNGRSDDDNLFHFCQVLSGIAESTGEDRPVLGVFAAWRGMSWRGLGIVELTFFGRKEAAYRIATGSIRELFAHLRQFRASNADSLLVIAGHSFGGLIVYSAVAQSLIEAAAMQSDLVVPSFADLVVLVNPAFEAIRYLPVWVQVAERSAPSGFKQGQRPVMVSVTAMNDWATKWAFPIGNAIATRGESTLGAPEREALWETMGHMDWLKTHELSASPSTAAAAPHLGYSRRLAAQTAAAIFASDPDPHKCRTFSGGAVLTHTAYHPFNPFWVVQATKAIIDGHNGIFHPVFLQFLLDLVLERA